MSSRPSSPAVISDPALIPGEDPVSTLEAAAWALAALISTLRDGRTAPLADVLAAAPLRTAVLEAARLVARDAEGLTVPPSLLLGAPFAEAKLSSLRQAAAAAARDRDSVPNQGWALQDDEVLLSQGRASAGTARALATKIVPELTGLAGRLEAAGSRILDIGTGVAAIAITLARAFPRSQVVGIDVLERALNLARAELDDATDVAGRVSLRQLDLADLTEQAGYDLVWLPAPFLSEAALSAGLPRAIDAVRPGGWIIVATNPVPEDPLLLAIGRWTAALNHGSACATDWMTASLTASGLREMRIFPVVRGGPVLLAARRPES
jgi:protein-L-isoaspartate O-methyltransferase